MRMLTGVVILGAIALLPAAAGAFDVTWGSSWDNVPLQTVLDQEYGPGAIDAANDYEGHNAGDADPAYWVDMGLHGLIVREIAGFSNRNTMGWYAETLGGAPVIDGVDDGVVFDGPMGAGSTASISFPAGVTQFGFYLDPNGSDDGGANAPQPELFFTNRFYNDLGATGGGAAHAPLDGDPQCLIYNITALKGGIPTFVLAWEDLDSGGPITPSYDWNGTDNDFQDLVVEIQAVSPVPVQDSTWGGVKALYRDR